MQAGATKKGMKKGVGKILPECLNYGPFITGPPPFLAGRRAIFAG